MNFRCYFYLLILKDLIIIKSARHHTIYVVKFHITLLYIYIILNIIIFYMSYYNYILYIYIINYKYNICLNININIIICYKSQQQSKN